ncbi:MAG TPA: DegT/DnrJ/EryC1/StrS family aminotransferase [Tepidisphaeraceae bacterium]|nr:DegT/DnrJ/EryC1/StrS family aminotransferase [Tepidisphaeraceae bacterium]
MPETTTQSPDTPAAAGGKAAKTKPFRKVPRYGEAELDQLKQVIAQGTLFYAHGKKVFELEKAFAAKHGAPHAIACTSGTTAIHIGLIAAGISPGDEVITAPITDAGTVLPILWQGAIPVFADLGAHTYNMDPASVKARVTPKTKAILAVHLAGNACDLYALRDIADEHKIFLIEDCAQAHGTRYHGNAIGTIGQIGCFSYNEFKHISCGDGGIVVTDDEALARKMRLATDKGYNRAPGVAQRNTNFLANNYRMTELQGAVALAQLAKLDSIVERRRKWCAGLTERLTGIEGLALPKVTEGCDPSWWFYMVRVIPSVLKASADEFVAAMKAEGVPLGAHYIGRPVYEYPVFQDHSAFQRGDHPFEARDYSKESCPEAEAILDTCVMLTINESYDEQDLEETAIAFHKVGKYLRTK